MLDNSARLLDLLSLLQRRATWTGPELAERLGITTRSVRRDIDKLRQLGYPVESATGPTGGYTLGPGADLPPLQFDDEEATAVWVALATTSAAVTGFGEAAVSALGKLDRLLPARLRPQVRALAGATVTMDGPAVDAVDPEMLVQLSQACTERLRVRLTYVDREGRRSERRVDPHRLVSTGRRWYLVAWDVDRGRAPGSGEGGRAPGSGEGGRAPGSGEGGRAPGSGEGGRASGSGEGDAWRTLRVDRIVDVETTGHRFVLDDPPEAAELVSRATTVAPYRWTATVIIEAPRPDVEALVPPTVAVLTDAAEGRTQLVTGADSLAALAGHLVALDLPFEVLDPPELRSHLLAAGRRLVSGHRTPRRGPLR